MKTVYDLRGVHPGASDDAVKAAFRAAAKSHHPISILATQKLCFDSGELRLPMLSCAIQNDGRLTTGGWLPTIEGWRSNVKGFGRRGCTSSFPERSTVLSA